MMRKMLTIICLLIVAVLFSSSWLILRQLPVDTNEYVAQKYAGWNGVLQAWIYSRWSPGGSFIPWLNKCASDFEKGQEGVYVEFTPVSEEALRTMNESGIPRPDMIFFSPGVLTGPAGLRSLNLPSSLREELAVNDFALPVALGGYIWVYNRALTESAPTDRTSALPITLPTDEPGRSFSAGLIGLLSNEPGADSEYLEPPDAGIDLGLPANAAAQDILQSENALELFIDGKLAALPVSQKELARLIRLRDSGRGPDWACSPTGEFAWTDQLLLMGIVNREGTDAAARAELAKAFAAALLGDTAQSALKDIGAFPVTGETIYPGHSPYAELDALLAARPICTPDAFSEHSIPNAASIIRRYCTGEIPPQSALAQLGYKSNLQNAPN